MKPAHYGRYIQEVAQKARRIGAIAALAAIGSIVLFYLLDQYDLRLSGTLLWRGIGLFGALVFLLGWWLHPPPRTLLILYAAMLSGFVAMMNGIAFLIFSNPESSEKQEFAVTVGCMTVWLVIAMIASGARRYMAYTGIFLMGILAAFLLAYNVESVGFIFSIYLTAAFAIIVMRNQEKQEREKATYLYELEEREEKIARQRQELQHANENLVSFNYAITHDLKGPLRLAQSFTQLLERRVKADEPDRESVEEFFGHIKNSHGKIHQIIEDLLLLSRIGKSGLDISEVELEPMARSVWREQTAASQREELQVTFNGLGTIRADAKLVWHVLSNLLSNAVKYTRYQAKARVEVGAYKENGRTVIFVKDNGAGFDIQFAKDLGKPFKRLHSSHQFEGTGIGLAIVRQIVQLHQGQFWAEGAEGAGAAFYCAFPDKIIEG